VAQIFCGPGVLLTNGVEALKETVYIHNCHLLLLLSPEADNYFNPRQMVEGWVSQGTTVRVRVVWWYMDMMDVVESGVGWWCQVRMWTRWRAVMITRCCLWPATTDILTSWGFCCALEPTLPTDSRCTLLYQT